MNAPRAMAVVATYNEAPNIERLLREIAAQGVEVVVVDDHSPDGTGEMVEGLRGELPGVHAIRRAGKLGYGTAHIAGFRYAMERGCDPIISMDADFSHDPAAIPALLEAAREYDVVVGARYVPGGRVVNWPLRRKVLSRWANLYVRTVLGLRVPDATSGYRCYHRRVLEAIDLDSLSGRGYAFLVEILYRCQRAGFRIGAAPITFVERRAGASKMSRGVILEAVILPWRLRFSRIPGAAER
jgi:dolichol-phosphate mannosyltransferase